MFDQKRGWEGGSLTVLQPDGTEAKFSPVYGKGIYQESIAVLAPGCLEEVIEAAAVQIGERVKG